MDMCIDLGTDLGMDMMYEYCYGFVRCVRVVRVGCGVCSV